MKRSLLSVLAAVVASVFVSGAAWAVSAGNYSSQQMDCTANASANDTPHGTVQHGCHNFALNVSDGHGTRYAEFGLDQLPTGYPGTPGLFSLGYPGAPNAIHSGCLGANTNGTNGGVGQGCGTGTGTGFELNFDTQNPANTKLTPALGMPDLAAMLQSLASGVTLSLGADDNLDAGEHDGVDGANGTLGSVNGPSDGGGIEAGVTPTRVAVPTLTDPLSIALLQAGACADGVCLDGTTRRQTAFQGCGANANVSCSSTSPQSRDVANYDGKKWDPQNCSSGDTASESPGPDGCGSQTMDQWRADEAHNVYNEPGFQFYEDPDPEASPAGPYPLPALYVGTCGVVAGGGVAPVPATPLTNSAHQLVISTGC